MTTIGPQPDRERQLLLRQIEAEAEELGGWSGQRTLDRRVLEAMAKVPREAFVPPAEAPYAYDNIPLPIGYGQTISQPFMVAVMTDFLRTTADDVILEIGTGSGYQSAVLSRLVRQVYSVEVIGPLAEQARVRLAHLGYTNVEVRHGDGYHGWAEHAPFDGIIVTAAAPDIPPPLIAQLKNGRRLVIPLDDRWREQELVVVEKDRTGTPTMHRTLPVAFVPLTRSCGSTSKA